MADFLTKKRKVNKGEISQYYVENSHPAIISPEVAGTAQAEMMRRKSATCLPEQTARREILEAFINRLRKQEGLITGFGRQLWYSPVGSAAVCREDGVRFTIKDGTAIRI